jgi:hypothetical protein
MKDYRDLARTHMTVVSEEQLHELLEPAIPTPRLSNSM